MDQWDYLYYVVFIKVSYFRNVFWCLQFLQKNERKQVDLRYHCSKVEFICSFFTIIHFLKICFRVLLTFSNGQMHERQKMANFESDFWSFRKKIYVLRSIFYLSSWILIEMHLFKPSAVGKTNYIHLGGIGPFC